jgi:hypothetical protein
MLKDAAIAARRVCDRCPSTIINGFLVLLAIATGFAFALHVVGFRVVNPFDTSWLWGMQLTVNWAGRFFVTNRC